MERGSQHALCIGPQQIGMDPGKLRTSGAHPVYLHCPLVIVSADQGIEALLAGVDLFAGFPAAFAIAWVEQESSGGVASDDVSLAIEVQPHTADPSSGAAGQMRLP